MASEFDAAPSIAPTPLQTGATVYFRDIRDAMEAWLEAERDQLALWLPVAIGTGIAAWFALPDSNAWTAAAAVMAGIALTGLGVGFGSRLGRALLIGGLAALIGLGLIWAKAHWVAAPRVERPAVASFSATVGSVERLPARELVRLRLAPDAGAGLPPRIRVNVDEALLPAYLPTGTRIDMRARLMPPAPPMVPGAYDYARVAWFQGIGATGKALDRPHIQPASASRGFSGWLWDLRARLTAHIEASIAGESEGGVAASFITGDQGAIGEADAEALRRAGLAHLLSVSGLHVSAVVGGLMLLSLRLLALSPRLALHAPLLLIAAGAGAVGGIGYTLLASIL